MRVVASFALILSAALLSSCFFAVAQTPQAQQQPAVPVYAQNSQPKPSAKTHGKPRPSPAKEDPPAPVQAPPAAPLAPLTLDQQPAVAPQVSYQTGELTIIAQNSTLGDILRAVRNRTGASFDVPPNATERVVGRFGPGPAREVLATLLNGSHFNYVMLGSAKDPNAMSELILTPKSGPDNVPPQNTANVAQPMPQQQVQQFPEQAPDGSMEGENAADAGEENVDQGQAVDQQNVDQDGAQGSLAQPNGQPMVKTPQQLLQELQQQQLQQQQQVQQQQQQQQQGQNPQGQQPNVVFPNPQPPQRQQQ
jgi:hypothetical protein